MIYLSNLFLPFRIESSAWSSTCRPSFGQPGRIDLLLGVDIFAEVVLHGRWCGLLGSPVAFETHFGWVLAGNTSFGISSQVICFHHVMLQTGDDILHHFWEVERVAAKDCLTPEESAVTEHFQTYHTRSDDGRFFW